MKRYQVALLFFAFGVFSLATLAVIFGERDDDLLSDKMPESNQEFRTVSVFFSNSVNDPAYLDCSKVYPVERIVGRLSDSEGSATAEFAYLALADLLKGPTEQEGLKGFFTSINDGSRINRVIVDGNVAAVDFNNRLNDGVAGSCLVQAIRSQIEMTLLQFPEITRVVISVNGNSEEILQP